MDFSDDMMNEKFSRHDFKLRTFESRVKDISQYLKIEVAFL